MTSRTQFLAGGTALAFAAAAPQPVRAAARLVRVAYFPGVSALPLLAAVEFGTFTREAIEVTATPTASSADLFSKLDAGTLDVGHTTIDNPVAYDVGAGAVPLAHRDFVAFLGVDNGQLRLVARPGIAKIDDLRGKMLAVDNVATGFTFALRAVLAGAGLAGGDVTLVERGGTQQRAQVLMAGGCDATLLTPPFDLVAGAAGFSTLARVIDVVGPYQGIAAVARKQWLSDNRDVAVRYARGYRAALAQVIRDRAAAVALLATNLRVAPEIASASYDVAFGPSGGVQRNAAVDLDGLRTVLRLRARYAPPGAGDDPAPYVETSILAAAR
jgi:ABC-type nitrate/sulfonate/bicarbonate transport system substrate-binding protein